MACGEVGQRRAGIAAAVEVFSGQRGFAGAEPCGGTHVQRSAARMQQRGIGAIADQRMAEHKFRTVRPDQEVLGQHRAVACGVVEQMAERVEREALAEDRRGLQRRLVASGKAVHPGMHQGLDRPRQGLRRGVLGTEQQLFEEQRIALGPRDAAAHQRFRRGRGARGHAQGIVRQQRTKVDADQRRAVQRRAPCECRRITGEAGRHHQKQRMRACQCGQGSQPIERPRIGPMDVVDEQQQRGGAAGVRGERAQRAERAAVARSHAHRR